MIILYFLLHKGKKLRQKRNQTVISELRLEPGTADSKGSPIYKSEAFPIVMP
jgi:hypothetical protein